jgi:hypothetical protein
VVPAVPPGAAVAVQALAANGNVHQLADDAACLPQVVCHFPQGGPAVWPPGWSEGAGRTLPVFFGHLLI